MRALIRFLDLGFFLLNKLIFRKAGHAIAIIKIDAIGDYLVFRNCLQAIAESEKYKGFSITLIGNALWKELATTFDSKYVKDFIWIDPLHLNSISKRRTIFRAITKRKFKQLITFHHSRALATDLLSLVVNASEKITLRGDELNINTTYNKITSRFYNKLVEIPHEIEHEFEKNKYFTSWLTKEEVKLKKPHIELIDDEISSPLSLQNYIVIAPGAGIVSRQIPPTTLRHAIDYLLKKKILLYIVGSANEESYVKNLLDQYEDSPLIKNLVGKTSLKELAFIVKNANAVICSESSIYHLAISLSKKTICFAGGGHFNRFARYTDVKDVHLIFHQMPCFNCDWNCVFNFDKTDAYPCIKKINPAGVVNLLTQELNSTDW